MCKSIKLLIFGFLVVLSTGCVEDTVDNLDSNEEYQSKDIKHPLEGSNDEN